MAENTIPAGYRLVPDTDYTGGDVKVRMEPGKAAAFDRWMAQGGGLRNPYGGAQGNPELRAKSTYRSGPMKGMTYDQAMQKFESMWGSASPAIRAKYDARARGPVARVGNAELNAARPGETPAQMVARQKASRMGGKPTTAASKPYDKDKNGVPDMIQRVPTAAANPGQDVLTGGGGGDRVTMESAFGSDAMNPFATISANPYLAAKKEQDRKTALEQEQQSREQVAAHRDALMRKEAGVSPPAPPVPAPVAATPVKPAASVPPTAPPAPVAPSPIAATKPTRINSLTGLPMGYRPGDTVAPAQQAKANESVSNQGSATAFGGIEARPTDIAAANGAMRSQGMVVRTPTAAAMPRGPASYQSPIAPGGAFSKEAYARTAAAQQTGIEQQAIRGGTASAATKAKHPDLVSKIASDTTAMKRLVAARG